MTWRWRMLHGALWRKIRGQRGRVTRAPLPRLVVLTADYSHIYLRQEIYIITLNKHWKVQNKFSSTLGRLVTVRSHSYLKRWPAGALVTSQRVVTKRMIVGIHDIHGIWCIISWWTGSNDCRNLTEDWAHWKRNSKSPLWGVAWETSWRGVLTFRLTQVVTDPGSA